MHIMWERGLSHIPLLAKYPTLHPTHERGPMYVYSLTTLGIFTTILENFTAILGLTILESS